MKKVLSMLTTALALTLGAEVVNDLVPYAAGTYDADFWDARNHVGVIVAQNFGIFTGGLVPDVRHTEGESVLSELETRWMSCLSSALFSCETGAPGFLLFLR